MNSIEIPAGRIVALDPGTKRVGVAVSDERRIIATPLPHIERKSWKSLLTSVQSVLNDFDAVALVLGLPLESDGSESEMSLEARDMARKFELSLEIPIFLQDERATSYEAKSRMWEQGVSLADSRKNVDSEAAAIILTDFISSITTSGNK
jgi:putative Holliday junction resolvase